MTEPKRIVLLGDSTTIMQSAISDLLVLLGRPWEIVNAGVGGEKTGQMLSRLSTAVFSVKNCKIVIVLGGVNDIAPGDTEIQIETNLQDIYDQIHGHGIAVAAQTIAPFKGPGWWTVGKQAIGDAVNAWILGAAFNCDFRIDVFGLLENPGNPDCLLPAYDFGDHVHWTEGGSRAVQQADFVQINWGSL